jgi:hypothetical protein
VGKLEKEVDIRLLEDSGRPFFVYTDDLDVTDTFHKRSLPEMARPGRVCR